MSLKNYDKALLDKIKAVYNHTIFAPLESALAHSAEFASESVDLEDVNLNAPSDQKVALPLIAIDRVNVALAENLNKPFLNNGRFVDNNLERGFMVTLGYQIDIISTHRIDVDSIWRELIFVLLKDSSLTVPFIYNNEEIYQKFQYQITGTNTLTDVEGFMNTGRLYRQSIDLEIPRAYMLFVSTPNLIEDIPVEVYFYKEYLNKNV